MGAFADKPEPYNWSVIIGSIVLAGVVVFFLGLGVLASAAAIGGMMLGFYMLQTGWQKRALEQGKGKEVAWSNWAYIIGGALLMACQLVGFVGFIFINFSGLGTMIGFFGAVALMVVGCVFVYNQVFKTMDKASQTNGGFVTLPHIASSQPPSKRMWPTVKGLMGATCLVSQLWFFGSVAGFIASGPLFFVVPFVIAYAVVCTAASVWLGQALAHWVIDCFGCGGDLKLRRSGASTPHGDFGVGQENENAVLPGQQGVFPVSRVQVAGNGFGVSGNF